MTGWVPDLTGAPPAEGPSHILDLLDLPVRHGVAVVDAEGSFTYRELDLRSAAIAEALLARGVTPGDPVVVHARLSRWAVVAMIGVLRAGARYVPVDAGFPVARQHYMAEACGARFAVVEPGLAAALPGLEPVAADVESPGEAGTADPEPVRGSLAYTYFTSGSTGRPKGVTVSAAALAHSTACRVQYYRTPVSAFLLCSSISFDSSVAGIYWTLACGGSVVIPSDRPADVLAIARAAREHRASHLLILPSLYNIALRSGLADRLGTLSTVIVAGEACPPALVGLHFEHLPGTRLYNEYGPTECTVWSTVHECGPQDLAASDVPIGGPIPGARLYVRSATGEAVTPGAVGELYIGGPGLAESVRPAELYRTGDLVSVTADGELRFHGRADRQLKIGGVRIERAEIERALTGCRGVVEAAVGVGQVDGRDRLVAFVVAEAAIDGRALRGQLMTALPAVAVPSRIDTLPHLPSLPNGKVDHDELDRLAREALLQGPRPTRES